MKENLGQSSRILTAIDDLRFLFFQVHRDHMWVTTTTIKDSRQLLVSKSRLKFIVKTHSFKGGKLKLRYAVAFLLYMGGDWVVGSYRILQVLPLLPWHIDSFCRNCGTTKQKREINFDGN